VSFIQQKDPYLYGLKNIESEGSE